MLGCFAAGFRNRNISALTPLPPFAAWARHLHFASWTFLCSHAEVSNCPDTFLCLGVITSVSLSLDSVLGSINLLYCSLCRSLPQPPSHQHASHPPIPLGDAELPLHHQWSCYKLPLYPNAVEPAHTVFASPGNPVRPRHTLLVMFTPSFCFFSPFLGGLGGRGGGVKCRLLTEASGSHPHGWMVV